MVDTVARAFVIGHPISHSRSPLIHGTWLKRYGITGTYEAIDVEPDALDAFFEAIRAGSWTGGNVTIPHKIAALRLVDHLSETARAIGAVNTIFRDSATGELTGHNTDASGFADNLDATQPEWRNGKRALVLGAGGAAPAVIFALLEAGYDDIVVTNRSREKAEGLVAHFGSGLSALDWDSRETGVSGMDLIVNTTALGMAGQAALDISLRNARPGTVVTDIVYTPLMTPLLEEAEAMGLPTVTGLGMLLHQAVPGFEGWFGVRPEVDGDLHNLVLADIEKPEA